MSFSRCIYCFVISVASGKAVLTCLLKEKSIEGNVTLPNLDVNWEKTIIPWRGDG